MHKLFPFFTSGCSVKDNPHFAWNLLFWEAIDRYMYTISGKLPSRLEVELNSPKVLHKSNGYICKACCRKIKIVQKNWGQSWKGFRSSLSLNIKVNTEREEHAVKLDSPVASLVKKKATFLTQLPLPISPLKAPAHHWKLVSHLLFNWPRKPKERF